MPNNGSLASIVTPERINRAVNEASKSAERNLHLSAFDCAALAVSEIFDPVLQAHADLDSPQIRALRLRIIDEVERRLGVHRRRPDVPFAAPACAALSPAPETNMMSAA